MSRLRWSSLLLAIAIGAMLVSPAVPGLTGVSVLAHSQLVASSPAAGTVLEASPEELRLVFSEPLEAQVTSLDVVAQDGAVVLERAGHVDPADRYALVVTDPNLPEGVYSITWRTLSAADGHAAEGFFSFGIGDVADAVSQVPGGMTHTERDPLAIAARWLTYIGLLLALGLAVFHRVVIRIGPMPRRLTVGLAGALAITAVATITAAIAAALDVGGGDVFGYLFGSRNGLLQTARAAVASVGAALLIVAPRERAAWIAGTTGLVGIILLVAAGHASALTGPAPIVGGVVHVAAAAAWIGGLVGLLAAIHRPDLVAAGSVPRIGELVPRFSAIALVSIGLVGLSGFYSAYVQTGELLPLDSEYGRTLLLKGIVAIAAIGLGGLSFLDAGRLFGWLGGLRERLRIEVALVALVLALTAALAITPPTEGARGVAIAPIPDAFGDVAPDMRMEIGPGRAGVNRVTVVTSEALAAVGGLELTLDRIDDGSTTRVPLTLAGLEGMEEMDGMDHASMAERNPDGTVDWYADALVLPPGSSWETSVHVMSETGTELTRQRFAFSLGASGIEEGQIVTLATPATGIAVLLLVGGALGLGLGLGGVSIPRCDAATSRLALAVGGVVAVALGVLIGVGALVG